MEGVLAIHGRRHVEETMRRLLQQQRTPQVGILSGTGDASVRKSRGSPLVLSNASKSRSRYNNYRPAGMTSSALFGEGAMAA